MIVAVLLGVFISAAPLSTAADSSSGNELDPVLESWEAPKSLSESYPYYLSGEDEEGRPLWIVEFGKWDLRAISEAGPEKEKEFDMYFDQFLYRIQRSIKDRDTAENHVNGWTTIWDLEGFQLRQVTSPRTLRFQLQLTQRLEKAARNMDYGFIINMSYLAERFIEVIRPALGNTLSRSDINGTDKSSWLPKLLKKYPKASLPEWYGGNKDFVPLMVYG